jgi:hypothetical protein
MIRALATALLCGAAIIGGDVVFRTSLLSRLRPIILTPGEQALADPPVNLSWEGPQRMRVFLSNAGEEPRDLGIQESPFLLAADLFPRAGGYQVDLRAVQLGAWIRASRRFQVQTAPAAPPQPDHGPRAPDVKDLHTALDAARTARDRAHERTKFLREENAALRGESERVTKQLEALYKTQEEDAERVTDLERRLRELADENRALTEENAAIRLRLSSVVPCSVWGYYSYPRMQIVPVTHPMLMVSDLRGQVFRAQAECELVRRADVSAASVCFCVGNSWGG